MILLRAITIGLAAGIAVALAFWLSCRLMLPAAMELEERPPMDFEEELFYEREDPAPAGWRPLEVER